MKKILLPLLTLISLVATSCSSEPPMATLTPKGEGISGDLSSYYTITTDNLLISFNEYDELTNGKWRVKFLIDVEKNSELPFTLDSTTPFGRQESGKNNRVGFGCTIYNKSGEVMLEFTPNKSKDALHMNGVESVIEIQVNESSLLGWDAELTSEEVESLAEFEVTTLFQGTQGIKKGAVKSTQNSVKWDKILDKYEKMVTQYIKLLKKAQKGDMAAMSEYAEYLEEATDLQEQLDEAQGYLTTSQVNRLVKIAATMTEASL